MALRDWFSIRSADPCAADSAGLVRMTIKLLDGRAFSVSDDPVRSVGELKRRLAAVCGIQQEHQRLVFCGRALRDDFSLEHYQLSDRAVVHVVPALFGGGGPDGTSS